MLVPKARPDSRSPRTTCISRATSKVLVQLGLTWTHSKWVLAGFQEHTCASEVSFPRPEHMCALMPDHVSENCPRHRREAPPSSNNTICAGSFVIARHISFFVDSLRTHPTLYDLPLFTDHQHHIELSNRHAASAIAPRRRCLTPDHLAQTLARSPGSDLD